MTTTAVADELVSTLAADGLDTVIGVGGTHTMRLLGALEGSGALRFVPARTELGAAHMALGYAKATGRAAVVLTSTGPGCLNVTAALQDAVWSSTPMLHITTSVTSDGFAGLVHETPRQRQITELAGKATIAVIDDGIAEAARCATALVHARPRGPVTLEVPAGTWDNPSRPAPAPVPARDDEAEELIRSGPLRDVQAALDAAERPLLFIGGGALSGDGGPSQTTSLLELAEALQAPVITSHQGKAVADWDHPLYLGPWASEARARELCADADVALVLGSKLSALGTGYHQLTLPDATWTIGPGQPHPRYPQLRRIDADARTVAAHLATTVKPKSPWAADRIAAIRRAVRDDLATRSAVELSFVEAIAQAPEAPRLVSADMCKAGFWLMKHLPARGGAVHAFSSYLTMGTALPMAIGLTLGRGEPSLAVVGDGGLQMSLSELATLAELRLPVALMVGVDGAYGMLRDNSAAVGGSTDLGLTLWNPNLHQLAASYGIRAEDIASPDDLRAALAAPTTAPRMLLVSTAFNRSW